MFLSYFTDPIFQAPMIGSILMCLSSALIGVLVFLKKRSLLGETLSHAAYPGVVLSVLGLSFLFPGRQDLLPIAVLIGAFLTALLGLWLVDRMEGKWRVKNDAALCFVLSLFFGVGVLCASRVQFSHPLWYKTVQIFLYGQAATMTTIHIFLYAALALFVIVALFLLQTQIAMAIFDKDFSKSVGVRTHGVDTLLFFLLVLSIVIGIRSVGVVLMAGMLIAPAVAARQWTHRLSWVLILAGGIGALSGFFGNYLSIEIPLWATRLGWSESFILPTGPLILLSAASFALFSLLFAPQNGLLTRCVRVMRFRRQCLQENMMKLLWREGDERGVNFKKLYERQLCSKTSLWFLLRKLKRQGWIERIQGRILLTRDGSLRAARIVRLHRLWEAYLVFLGQGAEKVHHSAEEMEHIISPELEKMLSEQLGDPKRDPHAQPIPSKEETL